MNTTNHTSPSGEDAANGAMGEREAFDQWFKTRGVWPRLTYLEVWQASRAALTAEKTLPLSVEQKAALDLAVLNLKTHGDDQLLAAVKPLIKYYESASLTAEKVAGQEPVALEHVAVAEDGGKLRWMTGRRPRDCELYAMTNGGRAPAKLYAAPPQPAQSAEQDERAAKVYVECRECVECGHCGINDSHPTDAACGYSCDWTGPSPVEDKCHGCGNENVMTSACPKCSGRYRYVAEATIQARAASTQSSATQPAVGWFVQRSEFGPWVEVEHQEPGAEQFYRIAPQPVQTQVALTIENNNPATQKIIERWLQDDPQPAQTQVVLTDAPVFDAKHVSLKQRGQNIILTLELNGIESAPRYKVIPVNPGVVRAAASGGEA